MTSSQHDKNPRLVFNLAKKWLRSWRAALVVFLLMVVYVALIGIQINAGPYQEKISTLLSEKLGRTVRVQGALKLRVSLFPALLIRDVRVAQPRGFEGEDFLQVGEIKIALDLLPLLNKTLRAEELSGQNVKVLLQQQANGKNNWTFDLPEDKLEKKEQATSSEALSVEQLAASIDIKKIALTALQVTYRGVNGQAQHFALDTFEAAVPAHAGLHATASGRIDNDLPYKLQIKGGSLVSLAAGREPWPVDIQLEFIESVLNINGNLGEKNSSLRFGLGTPDLAKFGRLLEIDLPNAGAAGIGAYLKVAPGEITLTDLSGMLGKTAMQGQLSIDTKKVRPRLSGKLVMSTLDLRPFLGQDQQDEDPPTDLRALYQSLAQASFDLQELKNVDVDLEMKVDRWLSLPGDISNAGLRLKLEQGKLSLPLQANVAGVPLKGEIKIDASRTKPNFKFDFGGEHADIGGLAEFLTGVKGIEGKLGKLKLQLTSEGNRGSELMHALAVRLELLNSRLSYGNVQGGKPVGFTVDQLSIALPESSPLQGNFSGSLLGNAVDAQLYGGDLVTSMSTGTTPIEFIAQSKGLTVRIAGNLNANQQQADISFSVGAERAGEVASWFGLRPGADAPLALAGQVSTAGENWKVSNFVFQLGRSNMYVDVARTLKAGRSHLQVQLDASNIDSAELDSLMPVAASTNNKLEKSKTAKSSAGSASLDIPILPQKIVLDDADLNIRVRSVEGVKISVRDLRFDGHIRDGFMQTSPFHAELAETAFDGAVMLDLRNDTPRVQLWLSADNVNAGRIMKQLKLASDMQASLDHVGFYLNSQSSQLSGLIARAQLQAELSGGKLSIQDKNTKSSINIAINQGALIAMPGEKLKLLIAGNLDDTPLEINIHTASAKDLINPSLRVPFDLSIKAVQTELTLSGSLDRNIESQDVELALKVQGQKLNHLDKMFKVALPPWGPWSAGGQFRMSNRGYEVKNLRLQVGSSVLNGRGVMDTESGRSKLDVVLNAPLIQLEDFPTQGWTATGNSTEQLPEKKSADRDAISKKATQASDQVQSMLSPATLRKMNATLTIDVERVMSGKDQMGNGSLRARLQDGRAEIGPVKIAVPGGAAKWSLSYEPTDRDVQADLKIDIDNFEYGILARRIKPESDMKGKVTVHVDVAARAPRLSEILKTGKGSIEFAVWPENLKSGVFDMWAVNVLVALLPTLDDSKASKVNCAIGRFTLDQGKLQQRSLIIDTSEMRVTGNTSVNFADEKLVIRMQPQAKSSQFLSLSIPIEVRGQFDKFSVGPNAGDVLETVVRLATSVAWVPLKKLVEPKMPTDGSDVCVLTAAK